MSQFEVDPDSLTASAEVARRQRDHLYAIDGYVASACSRFEAFSGVLGFFQGMYSDAVSTARTGIQTYADVAGSASEAFTGCRDDYLQGDRQVYQRFDRTFSDIVDLAPYERPGSGSSVPVTGSAPDPSGTARTDDDKFELPKLDKYADKGVNTLFPAPEDPRAPVSPYEAGKRGLTDYLTGKMNHAQEAYYNRYTDMTPEEARDRSRMTADDVADARTAERIEDNASRDGWDAYSEARQNGASVEEANRAGQDAYMDRMSEDANDAGRRGDAMGAFGTYKGLYDGVGNAVGNAQDVWDGAHDLDDNLETNERAEDFIDRADDDSNETWGSRR